MKNLVITLLLAVFVVLTAFSFRQMTAGTASVAGQKTALVAIGTGPVPLPHPTKIGTGPVPVPPPKK